MSYWKAALAIATAGAVGYVAVRYVNDLMFEVNAERTKTNQKAQKAADDIRRAEEETARVYQQHQEAMAENDRKRAEDEANHKAKMAELKKSGEELKRKAKEDDEALTAFENKEITVEQLAERLKKNHNPTKASMSIDKILEQYSEETGENKNRPRKPRPPRQHKPRTTK